ncbi:TolC family protein [Oceanimonas marisflavi]|uniref:TolC family protein n=1 Tax=Oceanimonas marisflavi TaxID=2059724 RepID=UPI0018E4E85C|nr:TolC family protein [Oceanimonas marisflavi]
MAPQNFSHSDISRINQADRAAAFANMVPHGEVITLDEAIARALKYNLEQRVRLLEQSLAAGELEAGKFDMLPKLLANAGYSWRDDFAGRYSAPYDDPENLDSNLSSIDVSSEKAHSTADLTLSWNLLDFGASYYTAKQNADKLLIANERRRKAMHTLIQNVRTAYWRTLAAEQLGQRVRGTIEEAEQALQNATRLASERVSMPDESLRYQRNLLENLRLLESVERELASARIELTNLIGLLPGTRFRLEQPEADTRPLDADVTLLEERALLHNADLREQFYNVRIIAQDTRKALLRLLPGISFDYSLNFDDDRYLVKDQWQTAGVRVGVNLFNLLSAPSRMEAAERNETLAEARRMALQMSVLTQVHLARYQYEDALRQYRRADQIYDVDNQLEQIVRGKFQSNMVGEQTRISASVTTILSELRRYQAMARVQESVGRLQASLGMEPRFDSVDEIELDELRTRVRSWLERGISPETLQAEAPLPASERESS